MPHPRDQQTSRVLAPYRSPGDRDRSLERLTARAGGTLHTYGHSVEGRPLQAAVLPRRGPVQENTKRVLLTAAIHGIEYIGVECALGMLEALGPRAAGEAAELRRRAEIWVIPTLNPDAYARAWAQQGRGALQEVRCNARGVDLNRNFPRPAPQPRWALALGGWGTGSDELGNPFYRGTRPLSEPESAALDALMGEQGFCASANLHSTMGTLFPAHVEGGHDFATYRELCRALRRGQRTGRRYLRLASRTFDWFTGELEDHQHHAHRCWAVCVECWPFWRGRRQRREADRIFWRFNPHQPRAAVESDVAGLTSYFLAACGRPAPRGQAG